MQAYTCAQCGSTFQDYPSNRTGHTRYYCSRKCLSAWQAEHRRGENSATWKGGAVTRVQCMQCGKQYDALNKQLRRFPRTFCSRACKHQWHGANHRGENSPSWKGGAVQLSCVECGNIFERARSGLRPNSRYFCGRACKGAWQSKNIVAEKSPRWTGGKAEYYGPNWIKQAREARRRDGHRCRACGSQKGQKNKALDVHHIRAFKSFGYVLGQNDHYIAANDLANLVTLCPACHKAAEAGALDAAAL